MPFNRSLSPRPPPPSLSLSLSVCGSLLQRSPTRPAPERSLIAIANRRTVSLRKPPQVDGRFRLVFVGEKSRVSANRADRFASTFPACPGRFFKRDLSPLRPVGRSYVQEGTEPIDIQSPSLPFGDGARRKSRRESGTGELSGRVF
jgi:hypothetical protein